MRFLLVWLCVGCAPLDNRDPDGDGYSAADGDCDPLDPLIFPGVGDCPRIPNCALLSDTRSVSGPWDGHYVGGALEVSAANVVAPALRMERDDVPVPGNWAPSAAPSSWVFTPEQPLSPATTYAWSIEADEGCEWQSFTTSEAGLPVSDPDLLLGRSFEVSVEQSALDVTFLWFLGPPYWFRIDSIDGDTAAVTLAPTMPPGSVDQYVCLTTSALVASWDGAVLQLDGDRLELPVGLLGWSFAADDYVVGVTPTTTIELLDWSLGLVVHPDGTEVTVDHFTFTADTRNLGGFSMYRGDETVIQGDGTATNFCTIVTGVVPSFACGPCEDGSGACADIALQGHRKPGFLAPSIVDVPSAGPECDPAS